MQVFQCTGKPLATKKITVTDAKMHLPTAYMGAAADDITTTGLRREASACLITCETNDIRFSYADTTPTNDAGTAVGHVLAADGSILLDGQDQIAGFQFLNKVAGSAAVLQVTPFVPFGR